MRSVNALYGNGADKLLEKFVIVTRDTFKQDLVGVFMGIAYGGDVEMCARHWLGRGEVYGYDTFDDKHPDHLSPDTKSYEARCMDEVYQRWGTQELSLEWQCQQLAEQKLVNAHLVKGLVAPDACEDISHINLAWLDMDLNASMRAGYLAVADKIVPGGFLATHDVVPKGHIPGNYEIFYGEYFDASKWEEVCREPKSYFMAWRRRGSNPTLHIITTCFRLHNLRSIAARIAKGTEYFDLHWHIGFDGRHVPRSAMNDYADVLSLPFVDHYWQRDWPISDAPGFDQGWSPCFTVANYYLDQIKSGWIWFHDDDNAVHDDFFKVLYGRSIEQPLTKGWIFGQAGHNWTRSVGPGMVKLGHIDVAQYVLDRSLIGDARFTLQYGADGIFIERLFARHRNLIQFDNRVLTYHNWLR